MRKHWKHGNLGDSVEGFHVSNVSSVSTMGEETPGADDGQAADVPPGWQEVPNGSSVPEGSTVRFDMASGRTYVRLPADDANEDREGDE